MKEASPYIHTEKLRTRFPSFESKVLSAVCPDQETFDNTLKVVLSRQRGADTDIERIYEIKQQICNIVEKECGTHRIPLETAVIGISNNLLMDIYRKATGESRAVIKSIRKLLQRHAVSGDIPNLFFPEESKLSRTTRGVMWVGEKVTRTNELKCNIIIDNNSGIFYKTETERQ